MYLSRRSGYVCLILLVWGCFAHSAPSFAQAIRLHVDLTDAPRNIYHARLAIPAKPGAMTLVFPKWIPGNHRPSGPIAELTGIQMEVNNKPVAWQRDDVDMYAFHVVIPDGANELNVSLDAITSFDSAGGGGPAASSNLLDLNWNAVVLYPQGVDSDAVQFAASVKLPAGWKFGTALTARQHGDEVEFAPVSLTTLVDSPLIAGKNFREIELTPASNAPAHIMDIVADNETDLAMKPEDLAAYKKLVAETGALFGARHYRQYHFLYTLSAVAGEHGVEHHESNDSAAAERTLLDPDLDMIYGALIPHEFAHSWNGKYRRPAGLATRNYQEPMVGDLLWVYEGLTEYLGNMLAARSGLWTPEQYRESLALTAANLDHRTGREWRPLEDTGRSVQMLRMLTSPEWTNWRRSLDYYPEGELIWIEVDSIIRQQTHGQRSLDDFCRHFHGGQSSPPAVVPYKFEDIVSTLNEVAPYDWASLLKERVAATSTHAPLGGIERDGWRLVYNDQPNLFTKALEKLVKFADFSYSLGITVAEDGKLSDVVVNSPAYRAGVGPGMTLVAVNGQKWKPDVLEAAIKAAQGNSAPIELLVENGQFFQTYAVSYHDGVRNPHLERISGQPDLLENMLAPLTH